MPPLTWRNVDAPGFAGSLDGLRTASSMLGNATRSGIDLIDTIKQTNAEAADRAILNRALGIQDSDAFRAGLTDGTVVGPDAANASVDTLRSLDNRAGTLLNRDVTRQNLEQTDWTNKRTRDRDARMAAAASDYALASTLARDNNQADLTKLLSTSATLRALDPDQLAGLFTNSDVLSANAQARRASDSGFAQSQWRFGNEVSNAADVKTAQALWLDIARNSATTADVQAAVNKHAGTASPGVMAQLNNLARGAGYAINGPIGDGSGGLGVPSGSSGSTEGPLLERFIDGLAKLETAGGSKTVKGPAGEDSFNLFNIKDFSNSGSGFRAKDAAEGSNDRYRTYASPAAARADLKDLLARRYPKALTAKNGQEFAQALKDGGYATDPDYVKKLSGVIGDTSDVPADTPANQAAALLSQTMSRAGNNLGADLAIQQITERAGQNQAVGLFPELNALQADRREATDVVDELIGDKGALRGSDRGQVLGYINWLVDNSRNPNNPSGGPRINAAMAGKMLSSNIQAADNPVERVGSMIADVIGAPFGRRTRTGNLAGGIRLDDQRVYQTMQDYLSGGQSDALQAQKGLAAEKEVIDGLREQYNAADALYKSMLSQSKSRPGLVGSLEAYKQKRDAAAEALRRATQSAGNTGSLQPSYDRPVATTRGASGGW